MPSADMNTPESGQECAEIDEDLWVYLAPFFEVSESETFLQNDFIEQVLQTFNRATQSIVTESPLFSAAPSSLLEDCTRRPDLDLWETYEQLLPDPLRFRKLKLEPPLLCGPRRLSRPSSGGYTDDINIKRTLNALRKSWGERLPEQSGGPVTEQDQWMTTAQKEWSSLENELQEEKICISRDAMTVLHKVGEPQFKERPGLTRLLDEEVDSNRKYGGIPIIEAICLERPTNISCSKAEEAEGIHDEEHNQEPLSMQPRLQIKPCDGQSNMPHETIGGGSSTLTDKGRFCVRLSSAESDALKAMPTTTELEILEEEKGNHSGFGDNIKLGREYDKKTTKRPASGHFTMPSKRHKQPKISETDQSVPMASDEEMEDEDSFRDNLKYLTMFDTENTSVCLSDALFSTPFSSSGHIESGEITNAYEKGRFDNNSDAHSIKDAVGLNAKYAKIEVPWLEGITYKVQEDSNHEILPGNELEKLIRRPARPAESQVQQQDFDLPLQIPASEGVFEEHIHDFSKYSDVLQIPHGDVVKSFQILWKQPGLRILDDCEIQLHDLTEDKSSKRLNLDVPAHASHQSGELCLESTECDVTSQDAFWPEVEPGGLACDQNQVVAPTFSAELQLPNLSQSAEASRSARKAVDDAVQISEKDRISHLQRPATICAPNSRCMSLKMLKTGKELHGEAAHNAVSVRTEYLFPAKNSLARFLDLRGKKFIQPKAHKENTPPELEWDQIEQSQCNSASKASSLRLYNSETCELPASPALGNDARASTQLPQLKPLDRQRTIILNESLLQSKPSLVRLLEENGKEMLTMISRDLDGKGKASQPDIILDAKTCLIIGHVQSLSQRPLPGQRRQNDLPLMQNRLLRLSWDYDLVLVIIHLSPASGESLSPRENTIMAEFAGFCSRISATAATSKSCIVPVWISCKGYKSSPEVSNAWIWKIVSEFAFPRKALLTRVPSSSIPVLIHDETQWEVFLKCCGLNPLAAQLIVASMPQPRGLHQFVCMKAADRRAKFASLIGDRAITKVSRLLVCGNN